MTIFGWDASHYDGDLTTAILALAKIEGIEFFTHKIGEGLSNTDSTAQAALNAARAAGIRVIGGYYFIHSGDMIAQADRCIALADQYVPWWLQFAGWFWQTDAETDIGGHLPSPAEVKVFSDRLAQQSGRRVIVYASRGMYGDRLAGLGHPLWNANYPSRTPGPFRDLYPGDSWSAWTAYSGQVPAIVQFTSSATIAGLTTCDANAYRGTIDQLLTLIGGNAMTGFDAGDAHFLLTYQGLPATKPVESLGSAVLSAQTHSASADGKLDQVLTQIANLSGLVQTLTSLVSDDKRLDEACAAAVAQLPAGVHIDQATMQAAFVGALTQLAATAAAAAGGPAPAPAP